MITRVEVRHYKCLKRVDVRLHPFNILIGPNASGKSSLLDVFQFLQESLEDDVDKAVTRRTSSFEDLVWKQGESKEGFEIGLEAEVPQELHRNGYTKLRYEVAVGLSEEREVVVHSENLWLLSKGTGRRSSFQKNTEKEAELFIPEIFELQDTHILHNGHTPEGYRLVIRKKHWNSNNYFKSESTKWNIAFRLSPKRLSLSGIPEDKERFPIALWFRDMLREGIQILRLNSLSMRRSSPIDAPLSFQSDGSNLPVMVEKLQKEYRERYEWWVDHVKTTLQDLEGIEVRERPEDRSRYIVAKYSNGSVIPAWMLSDGTLRMLALTLLAYLPPKERIVLVEEPENGMHPKAIHSVYQALSSVYKGQILVATHSPLFMALAEPKDLLIFSKTSSGATVIVRGDDHPALKDWRKQDSLDVLFASGVLG
ncbi:SMC domain protein [Spirochaeta thermophila DSM 6578]|uniref:SMC domain protein n=1 Tax=Winmispira thermophila (strain ATCC 700085 / DSM 6578 / Z-1203) TaxID=869211 RepID=G0GFB5_WINT7|nr:AAA family ATPase [Spirochaeta thermophila]AEJ61529.1 SMC domain protein [Spirochaeta thermophila DSM 6578]